MNLKKQTICRIFLFCILVLSNSLLNAQSPSKDSLLVQIKTLRSKGVHATQSKAYVDFLNQLALKYRYRNADSIKVLSDEAFLLSSKMSYPEGKAFALLRRGDYYADTGLEEKAFKEYKKSKQLAFSLNQPKLKVEVLKSIASQEFLSQNLNKAVLTYYEAIDLACKNDLKELEARLRHNLGYCYYSYKLYDEAQIEYLVADSLNTLLGDNNLKAMTSSNIALNALDKGDWELSHTYNEASIALLEKRNEPLWLSRAFRVKARFYHKTNEFKTAQKWIRKSDSTLSKVSNARDQMEIDNIHSTILINLGDLNSAKKYALKVLKKALEFKDSIFQIRSYGNLERIEEQLGRTDSAYTYHKKSLQIKSLLNENHQVQNIVLLRAKMNFIEEKEALRLENFQNNLTQQKYFQWTTAALLALIILALIMYSSKVKEQRLNEELKEKSKTLAASEMDLKKTNANQKTLFSIVGHDLKGPISSLRELLSLMANEEDKEVLIKIYCLS